MTAAPDRFASVGEILRALETGSSTSLAICEAYLAAADRLDPQLGTYIVRFDDAALERAGAIDADRAAGRPLGPLAGVPIGVKDILATNEGPTTAQSLVLEPAWGAQGDGPVVARLREAGAIPLGKTSTMEFAIGFPDRRLHHGWPGDPTPGGPAPDGPAPRSASDSDTKPFPLPRNPWDTAHWTGGSSSGTGNGVAAGLFPAGLGTDTAGSVRLPASYCGVSGHKPTFGLVPKLGCVPLGFTFDSIGPLARTVTDCARLLDVMAGMDPNDPTTVARPAGSFLDGLDRGVDGLRLGVLRRATLDGGACSDSVRAAFDDAMGVLEGAGAEVVDVEAPLWDELHDACFMGLFGEAFAWHRPHMARAWDRYGEDTRRGIAQGALLSAGDMTQIHRVRRAGVERWRQVWADVDLVVTPTTGTPAIPFVGGADRELRLRSLYTPPFNSLGLPALAVPMGFDGWLPLSLQIAGPAFSDAMVLRAGAAFQALTSWHTRVPPLAAV